MKHAYRVLVVEDEPLLRRQLCDSLHELWPDVGAIVEVESGAAAMRQIAEAVPDIAFLDINLPDMSGIDIATVLRDRCQVVFVTAYSEFAIAAFEQHALDYVLKPATTRRLADTVARLKTQMAGSIPAASPQTGITSELLAELRRQLTPQASALKWISASVGATTQLIPVSEVICFNADDKYTEVLTATGEALIRKPIRELVEELPEDQFWQIHRSTIVRVAAIDRLVRTDAGHLEVKLRGLERKFIVSRTFAHRFRQM
ncbi:MAG: response regulator transcription factor [Betaproteobacteria bacterium]|nr:response regulator transcription factor [Betaproteobacteria bacterium]